MTLIIFNKKIPFNPIKDSFFIEVLRFTYILTKMRVVNI
jgi:hypothetical protein